MEGSDGFNMDSSSQPGSGREGRGGPVWDHRHPLALSNKQAAFFFPTTLPLRILSDKICILTNITFKPLKQMTKLH